MSHEYWIKKALELARKAEAGGEVPVGAVLVKDGQLIAEGWNQPIISHDATSHTHKKTKIKKLDTHKKTRHP